jgi:hypothetical protein
MLLLLTVAVLLAAPGRLPQPSSAAAAAAGERKKTCHCALGTMVKLLVTVISSPLMLKDSCVEGIKCVGGT